MKYTVARMKTGVFHIRAMIPPLSQSAGDQSVPGSSPGTMEPHQNNKESLSSSRNATLDIFKRPHGIDNSPTDIGLRNEERVGGNLARPGLTGRDNNVNRWPSVPYTSG